MNGFPPGIHSSYGQESTRDDYQSNGGDFDPHQRSVVIPGVECLDLNPLQ